MAKVEMNLVMVWEKAIELMKDAKAEGKEDFNYDLAIEKAETHLVSLQKKSTKKVSKEDAELVANVKAYIAEAGVVTNFELASHFGVSSSKISSIVKNFEGVVKHKATKNQGVSYSFE